MCTQIRSKATKDSIGMHPNQIAIFADTIFAKESGGKRAVLDRHSWNHFGLDGVGR